MSDEQLRIIDERVKILSEELKLVRDEMREWFKLLKGYLSMKIDLECRGPSDESDLTSSAE